jgi:plasmid stabilization system protein ParE
MTYSVVFTSEASKHVAVIDDWWRKHRPAAPDLFTQELSQAVDLLCTLPGAGRIYARSRDLEIRRVLLRSTRHHLYYTVEGQHLQILAVWSAIRGTGPDLRT